MPLADEAPAAPVAKDTDTKNASLSVAKSATAPAAEAAACNSALPAHAATAPAAKAAAKSEETE